MRLLFALPGLHRYHRGAEVAFMSVANELAGLGHSVTLMGSGNPKSNVRYNYIKVPSLKRELFEGAPSIPLLRNECIYEELTCVPGLLHRFRPSDYDATITCSFPFTNWILRRPAFGARRPRHIFVTQNGDWPAFATNSEYRLFGCDGLVCTNPDFYERNKDRWLSQLIPNGVDVNRFMPGSPCRAQFGLPEGRLLVLMVSALIESKRVELGIQAVSLLPSAHLVVAGDGPLREKIAMAAQQKLQGRFTRMTLSSDRMPDLYRSVDVLLHLSKEEAFGNIYIEAMATGLPIVAPDSKRVRWIVGNEEALFALDDPLSIASAIERSQSAEPPAPRADRAQRFSWKNVGKSYEDFILRVLASR